MSRDTGISKLPLQRYQPTAGGISTHCGKHLYPPQEVSVSTAGGVSVHCRRYQYSLKGVLIPTTGSISFPCRRYQ